MDFLTTSKMHEKISDVCVRWQTDSPFFAEFLLRFKYKANESVQTVGISIRRGKIYLEYAPSYIDMLLPIEVEGTMMHEIMHLLNKYHDRLQDRIHYIFNAAQDAAINETVLQSTIAGRKLALHKDAIDIKKIKEMGYKGESISETIYDFLYGKAKKIKIYVTGAGGGKCNGNKEDSGNNGTSGENEEDGKIPLYTTDNHEDERESNKSLSEMDKQVIEEIINHARSRSWGSISGNLQSKCESLIKTKDIPWKEKLRMYLSRYVNEPGHLRMNSWVKRNRRDLPLPGIKKLANKLLVSVDTSGSISDSDLQKFFYQIEKIVKDFSNLIIIEWDTKVQRHYMYKKGDWKHIKVQGRGGTDCQDLYNYIQEKLKNVAYMLVNFTDGYFDLNIENYGIPTIWAVVNNDEFVPKFGKVINIKDSIES